MADTPRTAFQAISESTVVKFKLATLGTILGGIIGLSVGGTLAVSKITDSIGKVEERTLAIPEIERRMVRIEYALGIASWQTAGGSVTATPPKQSATP